jgi:RNA recognition motif-containing protein
MTQIFVGNVADGTSEQTLRGLFERHGRVTSVKMAATSTAGQRRGFAFVTMPYFEDAEEAIARLNGSQISGRTLTVNEARGRKPVAARDPRFRWDLMVP